MELVIREATAQDYASLCILIDELDRLHRDNLPQKFQAPKGPVRHRDFILDLIADEGVGLFVAEAGGRLVGFVNVAIRDAPDIPIFVPRHYAVVSSLGVREGFRRMGIGCALMNRVQSWAVAKGATSIELGVYEFNRPAIAFYHNVGYETVHRRMSKSLRGTE